MIDDSKRPDQCWSCGAIEGGRDTCEECAPTIVYVYPPRELANEPPVTPTAGEEEVA